MKKNNIVECTMYLLIGLGIGFLFTMPFGFANPVTIILCALCFILPIMYICINEEHGWRGLINSLIIEDTEDDDDDYDNSIYDEYCYDDYPVTMKTVVVDISNQLNHKHRK